LPVQVKHILAELALHLVPDVDESALYYVKLFLLLAKESSSLRLMLLLEVLHFLDMLLGQKL
jgi:hypothetical protein